MSKEIVHVNLWKVQGTNQAKYFPATLLNLGTALGNKNKLWTPWKCLSYLIEVVISVKASNKYFMANKSI